MEHSDDSKLVRRIKRGDRVAFKELYDQYHRQIYFVAKKYLKDSELVEDAVQDVFIKFWDKRHQLDASKPLKGFLFTMLKHHVLNMVRDKKNRASILKKHKKMFSDKQKSVATDDEVIYKEYKELLKLALEELTPSQREVVKMKVFQNRSNASIAALRNVTVNTVKTQYYNGSKFIRDYLKKHTGN